MEKSKFYELLKFLPKAEIHVHEEAVLSRNTIKKVYKRSFNKEMSEDEYNSLFSYDGLTGFLDSFIKIQSYFTNIEDLTFLFDDFADYIEDNNIVYCEAFVSPTSHLKKGWNFSEMIKLINNSLIKIQKEKNRTVKILIDVSRSFGLENAMNNLNLVLKENCPNIIGIGLGGDEVKGPAKDYVEVFKKAKENNLHIVAHAGEVCDSSSMKDAINLLKVERIGHGITAVFDKDFMKELAETQIPLEICPTSNIFTKKYFSDIESHPFRKLFDENILVTVNTDDPTFFKVSLIDEYWNLHNKLGFNLSEIKQVIKNGFKASFLKEEEKENYYKKIDSAWEEWFKKNPDLAE